MPDIFYIGDNVRIRKKFFTGKDVSCLPQYVLRCILHDDVRGVVESVGLNDVLVDVDVEPFSDSLKIRVPVDDLINEGQPTEACSASEPKESPANEVDDEYISILLDGVVYCLTTQRLMVSLNNSTHITAERLLSISELVYEQETLKAIKSEFCTLSAADDCLVLMKYTKTETFETIKKITGL